MSDYVYTTGFPYMLLCVRRVHLNNYYKSMVKLSTKDDGRYMTLPTGGVITLFVIGIIKKIMGGLA